VTGRLVGGSQIRGRGSAGGVRAIIRGLKKFIYCGEEGVGVGRNRCDDGGVVGGAYLYCCTYATSARRVCQAVF